MVNLCVQAKIKALTEEAKNWDWTKIFEVLAREEQRYLEKRDRFLRRNRALSFVVAIVLAGISGLNTFQILFGEERGRELFVEWWYPQTLGLDWYKVGGFLLSAFAATAGASVWHDLLDKIRQSKEKASQTGEG